MGLGVPWAGRPRVIGKSSQRNHHSFGLKTSDIFQCHRGIIWLQVIYCTFTFSRQTASNQAKAAAAAVSPAAPKSASVDLLGLTTNPTPVAPANASKLTSDFDLLGLGAPAAAASQKPTAAAVENDNDFDDFVGVVSSSSSQPQQQQQPTSSSDLFADFSTQWVTFEFGGLFKLVFFILRFLLTMVIFGIFTEKKAIPQNFQTD